MTKCSVERGPEIDLQLEVGSRLGFYEIVAPLGAGGMGEVYRARDTRLDREVAIKVLPEGMSRDKERCARFEREAKMLASLNHPNIASIYGYEEVDGRSLLIMELVEGETLAERLQRGALTVEDALNIARQMAEALEAAHDKGIIHRDLKPANVKTCPNGKVKVLDFGLAKAMAGGDESSQTEIANSPTITADFTRPGVILGTAAYMSPEQARGKPLDKRSDIWSFGVVLLECLTGKSPFAGETISDAIGAILHKVPAWESLPPGTPPTIHLLLHRLLAKDASKRLRDVGDARIELENAIADPTSSTLGLASAAIAAATSRRTPTAASRLVPWGLVAILLAALAWTLMQTSANVDAPSRPVRRLTIPVSPYAARYGGVAVAPGGEFVIFRGDKTESTWRLYLRRFDSFQAHPLSGSEIGNAPFISPDSEQIAFFRDGYLYRVAANGGTASRICRAFGIETGTWGPRDRIVFSTSRSADGQHPGLSLVSANGQDARILTSIDVEKGERAHYAPSFLPDGRTLLFSIDKGSSKSVALLSLEGNEQRVLIENGEYPQYVPTGHILFYSDAEDQIFAVAFDLDSLQITGRRFLAVDSPGTGTFSVSQEGTLAYYSSDADTTASQTVVWTDRHGLTVPLISEQGAWANPRLSPTGDRLVVRQVGNPACFLWMYDLSRAALTRLTFEGDSHNPVWDASGKIVITGMQLDDMRSLYAVSADGSAAPTRLTAGEGEQVPGFGSADGSIVVFEESSIRTGKDVWVLDHAQGDKAMAFVHSSFDETYPACAPNGRLIAYVSDESGREEVYVRPYPGPGAKTQISTDGGTGPLWSRDGKELFFARDNAMIKVDIIKESPLEVSAPEKLFEGEYAWGRLANYDITPDGQRFVMIKPIEGGQSPEHLRIVINFFEVLRERSTVGGPQ